MNVHIPAIPVAKLSFGFGNAKLTELIGTFSLPAGHTCPSAKDCLSKANRETGKITDGPETKFRCFAATGETVFTSVRSARWNNFELLKAAKTLQEMADLIQRSLPRGVAKVRIHVSGDFFNETYFKAWLNVALNNPAIIFYGYTKQLPYLVKFKKQIPANFKLTSSKGGLHDALIAEHNLKYAEVVFSAEEARRKGLELDHDDSKAYGGDTSFALLIHGTQPKGTLAAEAWNGIKKLVGGYSPEKRKLQESLSKKVELKVV